MISVQPTTPNRFYGFLLTLLLIILGTLPLQAQQIVVNEYFNADTSSHEWVELLVMEKADFSEWAINDFDSDGSAQNKLTFSDNALWSNLYAGTLVLITGDDVNISPDTDPNDGIIVLRASNTDYFSGSMMDINASSDGIQIVDDQLNHVYALAHGSSISSGGKSPFVINQFVSLTPNTSLGFSNTETASHFNNYFYTTQFDSSEVTPAEGNDAKNTSLIDELRANRTDIPRLIVLHKQQSHVSGDILYFPKLIDTEPVTESVNLTNAGEPDLVIDSVRVEGDHYSMASLSTPLTIAYQDTVSFELHLDPDQITSYQGKLHFYSNDGIYENYTIDLQTRSDLSREQTFETVNWNLEWFGSTSNGPANEPLQLQNIATVMDSLQADLYAFQEVSDQNRINELVRKLNKGSYRGFVAEHIGYNQKTAFVYNTATIDSVDSGPIKEYQEYSDWATRYPFYFRFRARFNGKEYPVTAVNIHAKAGDSYDDYMKRDRAAEELHKYFVNREADSRIILMGDYNDDVDESIYNSQTTPYEPFVVDQDAFEVVTKVLSDAGKKSTVRYHDMIDHVTISNELFASYLQNSVKVFVPTSSFISNYGETTSDHYPVWATFDFTTLTSVERPQTRNEIPSRVSLEQNYPNPFNPTTQITYQLPASQKVTLQVYDMLGREVSTLVDNQRMTAGSHTVNFDGNGLASGIYIYRLRLADGSTRMRKMTLIK